MNERSTLELEDEMARLREELELAAEQERATRERYIRELTPERPKRPTKHVWRR